MSAREKKVRAKMNAQEERISRCIEVYDAQGFHRTGTDVDAASARWLLAEIQSLGYEAALEAYALSRIEVNQAFVEVAGKRSSGLPLFDGSFTDAAGISGRLGPAGSSSEIGVIVLDSAASAEKLEELRVKGPHLCLVGVTVGPQPGLIAHNATFFNSPRGIPVLLVSSEERAWLEEAIQTGATGQVVVAVERVNCESANIVSRLPGRDREAKPVLVTTPRSGWWNCASERGGGIACWFEVARRLAQATPARDVWFVAFSGHELGHLGLDAFLAAHPETVMGARAWVHFGANIGGATIPTVRVSASDAELLQLAESHLIKAEASDLRLSQVGQVLGLEPQEINSKGGRCLSLLGGNAFFHMPEDRWPDAVDTASVAMQANALTRAILDLAV